jgi:hypothetical protein
LLAGLFPKFFSALPLLRRAQRSPDGAQRNPGQAVDCDKAPDFAALHPGYDCVEILYLLMTAEQDPA